MNALLKLLIVLVGGGDMYAKSIGKQYGSTMFLTLVFMLGMFTFIGMATTTGRLMTDKAILQNALDAAALSAATSLSADPNRITNTANAIAAATLSGQNTFTAFKNAQANNELAGVNTGSLSFTYSKKLKPFTAGTNPPAFVRVSTNAMAVAPIWLGALAAFQNPINVSAVATAGPKPQNCTLVPFVMCAKVVSPVVDKDCSNDTNPINSKPDCYGYDIGSVITIKWGQSDGFTLMDVGSGANAIGNAMAGAQQVCNVGNTLQTKPGYSWGPVKQGIDDRFALDAQQAKTITYSQYINKYNNIKATGQRVMAIPIADCTNLGGTAILPVVGNACLFLTKNASDVSQGSNKQVEAEFIYSCTQSGGVTNPSNNGTFYGVYDNIQLYKTQGSNDS